jgi:hypothetical protein
MSFLVGLEQRDRYEEKDLRRRHDYGRSVVAIAAEYEGREEQEERSRPQRRRGEDEDEDVVVHGGGGLQRRIPSQLRPSDVQPTLFWVRVDIGKEREVLRRILERQKKFISRGSTLLITSALAKENHPGMVYMEAMQQKYAQKALTGIPYVKGGGMSVRMISRDGVSNILTVLPTITTLPKKMLLRVRVGKYKGDLCQVVDMDDSDPSMMMVNVVSRETEKEVQYGHRTAQDFSKEEFKLRIRTSQLITKGINATPDELKRYLACHPNPRHFASFSLLMSILYSCFTICRFFNGEVPSDVEKLLPESQQRVFKVGDRVRITRGESKNLTGDVKEERGEKMLIRSDHSALKGRIITVYKRDVEKNFREGDRVTFTGDSGDKRTGMVVKVDGPHVRVLPDGEKEVLNTRSFDVDFCEQGILHPLCICQTPFYIH